MKSMGRGLVTVAALLAGMAQAQDCREQLPQILASAYGAAPPVALEQVICKVWPARSELTLVAVPLPRTEHDGYGETDLELLITDSQSNRVSTRALFPGALDWDAFYVSSIAFDTAPYRVTRGQLAFGVRITRRGSSRVNPFSVQSLDLFLLEKGALRPLLRDLPMEEGSGEWDSNCAGTWVDVTRTLALAEQPGPNGFHDLLLQEKSVFTRSENRASGCETVEESQQRQRYRLTYDGERYVVPKELQRLR